MSSSDNKSPAGGINTDNKSSIGSEASVAATGPYYSHPISPVSHSRNIRLDSLINGDKWQDGSGKAASLTYSFGHSGSSYHSDYEELFGFSWQRHTRELTDNQEAAVKKSLGLWANVANLNFQQVTDSSSVAGDLRFSRIDFAALGEPALAGIGLPPGAVNELLGSSGGHPADGDVWLSTGSFNLDVSDDSFGHLTTIHEIGHALGLKHPHDPGTKNTVAQPHNDWLGDTVMSYRSYVGAPLTGHTTDRFPSTPMVNDIATVQYIYGANTSFHAGNDVYRWDVGEEILETIWDGGGIDTIDWSNQTTDALISLQEGQWSRLGPAYDPDIFNNSNPLENRTLSIARNAKIENAKGGSGNDLIFGNDLTNNLRGFGGDDAIYTYGGRDNRVDAGAGNDVVVIHKLNFHRIDGSVGRDQIRLKTSGQELDLTEIADWRTTGFEEIDLHGSDNALVLSPSDVVNLSKTSNTVTVYGDTSNVVRLTDIWQQEGAAPVSGLNFSRFVMDKAVVLVQPGITVSVEIGEDLPTAFFDLAAMEAEASLLNGFAENDRIGDAVSAAGDVNGDGYDDVILGAAVNNAAFVIFGDADGYPSDIGLDQLDGVNGFRIMGESGSDWFGRSVRAAGDVNNDGIDDLIVGASEADPAGRRDAGASYVLFGDADIFQATVKVADLDGRNGFALNGAKKFDNSGYRVDGAGDVNGDGIDDIMVGAIGLDGNGDRSGSTYVVYGNADGYKPTIDFKAIDGGFDGFRLDGVMKLDRSGEALRKAGDVNGDGYADVIIGAGAATRGGKENVGEAYVVFGGQEPADVRVNLGDLDGNTGFRLTGLDSGDWFGYAVSGDGDINGDGFDDLIIGAPGGDPAGKPNGGEAYVVFGKANGFAAAQDLRDLNGDNGFRIDAPARGDDVGFQVDFAGDVNGDGYSDLLVGAPRANKPGVKDAGAAMVVFGKADGFTATMTLQGPDGVNAFRINGESGNDQVGSSVSAAGDINGDGYDDVIIGAPRANVDGQADAGKSYVVYGQDYTGIVTHEGNAASNKILGTAGADVVVAGAGNDLLRGYGGADVLRGGAGNDVLAIADNDFLQLIGGNGMDTVRLDGDGTVFDLRAIPNNRVSDIERFSLNGDGNKLVLNLVELANLSDETNTLTISGNATNAVEADFAGLSFATTSAGGFTEYSVGTLTLRVDNDVNLSGLVVDDFPADTSTTGTVSVGGWATGEIAPGSSDKDWFKVSLIGGRTYEIDLEGTATSAGTLNDPYLRGVYDSYGSPTGLSDDNSGVGSNAKLEFTVPTTGDYYLEAGSNGATDAGTYKLSVSLIASEPKKVIKLSELNGTNGMTLIGIDADDYAGAAVATAGDLNNDGFDDVIVGAHVADPGGNSGAGESYVLFGGPGGFPATFQLAALNGYNGFRIDGVAENDNSGRVVNPGGDVNGDGIDDLILGADNVAVGSDEYAGAAYLVFGRSSGFSATLDLDRLDGSNGFRLHGDNAGDNAGTWVDGAGDVNGDGLADLIIGAPFFGLHAGAAYVVFGQAHGFAADIDLGTITGSNGFRIEQAGSVFGAQYSLGDSVQGIGDVNGDRIDDVLVGALWADDRVGAAFVVFGSTTGFDATLDVDSLNGSDGFRLSGVAVGDSTGAAVSEAGDFNGDGINDFVIGAAGADPRGRNEAGSAYVVFGKRGDFDADLDFGDLDGNNGFRLDGIDTRDFAGRAVSGVGDFNGDGFDDILVSAFWGDPDGVTDAGESYLVFGTDRPQAPVLNFDEIDGLNGLRIDGASYWDTSGGSVHGGGDLNGDGFDDLVVGAANADPSGRDRAGEAHILFGYDATETATEIGSAGNDTLDGDGSGNTLIGGQGNDMLRGHGGADVLVGGAGNDVFVVPDADFRRVSGGTGTDHLQLTGDHVSLDLTGTVLAKLIDIEEFHLFGTGNVLSLDKVALAKVAPNANQVTIHSGSANQAKVVADFLGDGFAATADGGYTEYSDGILTLRVDNDIDQSHILIA